jgi:hypothetical protein
MTEINYTGNISDYDPEDGKVIVSEIEDAKEALKNIKAEIAACDADADGNSADPDLDDLLSGNITTSPSRHERQQSLLRSAHKVNTYIDTLSGKFKSERKKGEMKLASEIKPAVDALEKEIIEAAVRLHKLHLDYFLGKRSFINNGIGLHGNFSSTIDDVLGVPVNGNTAWAWMFREAVKKGLLKAMPAGLK